MATINLSGQPAQQQALQTLFASSFSLAGYKDLLDRLFPSAELHVQPVVIGTTRDGAEGFRIGSVFLEYGYELGFFLFEVSGSVARRRVGLRHLVDSLVHERKGQYGAALVVFTSRDATGREATIWRLSYISEIRGEKTAPKRFSYVFGDPQGAYRTPIMRFEGLLSGGEPSLSRLREAFSVEALSKEFFATYKQHYLLFTAYLAKSEYRPQFLKGGDDEKPIRDYVKKLLGRIVFLHFLQKKGWLGVPLEGEWGEGDQAFMQHLYRYASDEQQDDFLRQVLEPLFAQALDADRAPEQLFDTGVSLPYGGNIRIPYLNGGLFERDEYDQIPVRFPGGLFDDLLEFFSCYNFTVDENAPNDVQVGIDPEMLGHIFENLLEDNRDKGAFYTPKEIVGYMCCAALTEYLQEGVEDEAQRDAIATFVQQHEAGVLREAGGEELVDRVRNGLIGVRVLDPAIGSGAFPMGMLNELFYCRMALVRKGEAIDPYELKKAIIQESIYGVDIERGAVDIARLRFWLSLVVDLEAPQPLPNFYYKIMQGDSLLESYKGVDLQGLAMEMQGEQYRLQNDGVNLRLRDELAFLVAAYFSEYDHARKEKLRQKILRNVQEQIRNRLIEVDFSDVVLDGNAEFFLMHTWFWEVWGKKGGFDIVIGNPPYIALQKNRGYLGNRYKNAGYSTFARTGDVYALFYERGVQLLREGGVLCCITSNKWMRAGYGQALRGYLALRTAPQTLIDFAGVKIFENATVDTNILLAQKGRAKDGLVPTTPYALSAHDLEHEDLDDLAAYVHAKATPCTFPADDAWTILNPIEASIKAKVEAVGVPLKDWDIEINYGIKTGYNDAFIIDSQTRGLILDACADVAERDRTEVLLKRVLRGRDIRRYGYDWAGLWLIYLPWHFPLDSDTSIVGASQKAEQTFAQDYPALYAYMLSHKDGLSGRNKAEVGKRFEWYALQRFGAKYRDVFAGRKVAWKRVGSRLGFSLVEKGMYLLDSTFFISSPDYDSYILAYLNSKLGYYWLSKHADRTGTGDLIIQKQKLVLFPVPRVESTELLQAIEEGREDEIDRLMYQVYGLSVEEIAHVERMVARDFLR